jgi:hypothetical protein
MRITNQYFSKLHETINFKIKVAMRQNDLCKRFYTDCRSSEAIFAVLALCSEEKKQRRTY